MSAPNPPLCVVCRVKPRHGSFIFCGKTCANKASTLCNNCYSKDKFTPYDYCGKKCAASAKANSGNGNGNATAVQAPPGVVGPQAVTNGVANGYSKNLPPKPYPARPPLAPAQPPPLPVPIAPMGTRPPNPNIPSAPVNGASVLQSVKQAFSGGLDPPPPKDQFPGQYDPAIPGPPLDCLVPGCNKPVHVDENGVPASNYCSQRHREQAVNSGIAPACIMCLNLPQGDTDYFCSRMCREEALSKPV